MTKDKCMRFALRWAALVLSSFVALTTARAETGVSENKILIGQSAGVTGPVAGSVKEQIAGAKVYIDAVNQHGGVNGRHIELVTRDDGFDPKKTPTVVKQLLDDDKVFALFMVRGTPENESILPLIQSAGVPLIAPSTGAASLRRPVNPLVFNVRAKYQDEVARAINQLAVTGVTSIGIFYAEDGFGADASEGFNLSMQARGLKPAQVQSFKRPMGDISASVAAFIKAAPQSILVVASGHEAVRFIKEMKSAGSQAQFISLSNNADKSFIEELGSDGRGVIITQIAPGNSGVDMPIEIEYRNLAKDEHVEATNAGMEGFMAAKVLVEGLRRAGNAPTRAKLVSALETFKNYDLGGIFISYGPDNHSGSTFVEMSIISSNGTLLR